MRLKETIRVAVKEAIAEEMRPGRDLDLLTVDDVARIFRVSAATVYGSLRHKLTSVRIGGCVRFRVEDVRAFIKENTHGGPKPAAPSSPPPSPEVRAIMERLRRGLPAAGAANKRK
jgi:excisionase family DNA binding protein